MPPAFAAAVAHEMGRVEALLKVRLVASRTLPATNACSTRSRAQCSPTAAERISPSRRRTAVRVPSTSADLPSVLRNVVADLITPSQLQS